MTWVSTKERLPDESGWYNTIKLHKGTGAEGFFKAIPPWKSSEYMHWKRVMKIEKDYEDRCVFIKYKAFVDLSGIEQELEEIAYWYELDPLPNEED